MTGRFVVLTKQLIDSEDNRNQVLCTEGIYEYEVGPTRLILRQVSAIPRDTDKWFVLDSPGIYSVSGTNDENITCRKVRHT